MRLDASLPQVSLTNVPALARAEWDAMPVLLTAEMLDAFCLTASEADLPAALKARYQGPADRLGLYTPHVPGEREAFWMRLADNLAPADGSM